MQESDKRIEKASLDVISLRESIRLNVELQLSQARSSRLASCIIFTTGYLGLSVGCSKIVANEPESFFSTMDCAV